MCLQDAKFVEERRKQLQDYLRMVMNKLIQTLPEFTAHPTKEALLALLPFCLWVDTRGRVRRGNRAHVWVCVLVRGRGTDATAERERERAREVQSSCSLWKTNLCGGNVLNSLFFVEKNTTVIETLNYSTLRTYKSCYMPVQKSLCNHTSKTNLHKHTSVGYMFRVACPSCCGSNCSKIQTLK